MKRIGKTTGSALLLIVLTGIWRLSYAGVGICHPFDFKIEPSSPLKKNAPITMSLTFAPIPKYPCGDSGSVAVTTLSYPYRDTLSDTMWSVQFKDGQPYSSTFQITIPDNDTTILRITLGCGWLQDPITRYFVTTEDTVQFLNGFRRGHSKNTGGSKINDPIRDTLTQKQLQTVYEVRLDLHDSTNLKIAKKILGPLLNSAKPKGREGFCTLKITLENLIKLADKGIKFGFTTPPPWAPEYSPPNDSLLSPSPQTDEINVDTLTQEQLQKEHEVMLWFRDSTERTLAEKLVGPMQDSLRLHGQWIVFRMRMTLERFLEIRKHNIDVHLLKPGEWREQAPPDSASQPTPKDSAKLQGASDEFLKNAYQSAGILLDHVDGLTAEGELARNQPITFYLRLTNWWTIVDGLTNGFRIYSPNGAQWSTTSADTLPLGWGEMFDAFFGIYSYSANGSNEDTVGFLAMANYLSGMPLEFDEVGFKITIGPIGNEYAGKTICLDSSFFGGAGYWLWSGCGGNCTCKPVWDGPHCFPIEPNQITFSGYLYYMDPVPPDTNQKPMRGVRIEMWDEDIWPLGPDLLASAYTEDDGYFVLGPVENDDLWGSDGQDVFFRIYAQNEAAYITESYNGNVHKMQTPVGNDLSSGAYDTTIVAPLDSSGPFFIANAVLESREGWKDLSGWLLPEVQVVSNTDGKGSEYYSDDNYIRIEGMILEDSAWPDTYDKDVIFHEYGHYIEFVQDFFDMTAGGAHSWDGWSGLSLASTEAFATFISGVLRGDPICRNLYSNFADTFWCNCENGEFGKNNIRYNSANNYGSEYEGSVAGMLWDIYDDVDDDYSTYLWSPPPPPNDSNPDGIGDTLSDGIDNILNTLLNKTVNGHHPDNINEFWDAWFQSPSFDHSQAMADIWYEHGVMKLCCNHDGIRGDADANDVLNVADLVLLVSYLFRGAPPPPCLEEADADGSGEINMADVTLMVNFIFKGGPDPAPCP